MCGGGAEVCDGDGSVVTTEDVEGETEGTGGGEAFAGWGEGLSVPHAGTRHRRSTDAAIQRAGRWRIQRALGRMAPRVALHQWLACTGSCGLECRIASRGWLLAGWQRAPSLKWESPTQELTRR